MAIKMDSYGNVYDDELFHYGKKGMKWGKHVMAQEKYWITGNGRNLGGGNMNSRMASDTSGIQWKRTVAPSGGFKPSANGKGGAVAPRNTRVPNVNTTRAAYNEKRKEINSHRAAPYRTKGTTVIGKIVPTSNPGIKGVNTTPQGGFGAKTSTSKKAEMLKSKDTMRLGGVEKPEYGARNALLFNSSVSNRVGSTMKKSISAIQKDQSGLLYKAKKTVNRIFKKISKFFGW